MPTVGPQIVGLQTRDMQNRAFASSFSHANEIAEPGYYSAFLDRYGVKPADARYFKDFFVSELSERL